MNFDPLSQPPLTASGRAQRGRSRDPKGPGDGRGHGKRLILFELRACWRCRGRPVGATVPGSSLGRVLGRLLAESWPVGERVLVESATPVALPCACSGARETLGISCAPHKERIGVSFTVCICNICRVVLWPTAHVLVCMMSMCKRSWQVQVVSDILCVAVVVCVPRTSRESFASTRACARGPRTFMANTACRWPPRRRSEVHNI